MTSLRDAAQQTLEALEYYQHRRLEWDYSDEVAITALKAALVEDAMQKFTDVNQELEAALAEPATCAWHGDEDEAYETSCGHIFQMLDGTPQENNFTHCCFCGKSMVQHLWEENNDD